MQQSSISALFGALSNEMRLNIIANNLANVNTPGYKGDKVAFQDVFKRAVTDMAPDARGSLREKQLLPRPITLAKPRLAEQTIDLSQGPMDATRNTFDLAIAGPGFFKVQTPSGLMLTRNGQFNLNAQGQLVTAQGYPVMGTGGPVNITGNGTVSISPDGNVLVDNQVSGAIDVVKVSDLKTLQKVGANLFLGQDGNAPVTTAIDPAETKIYQGYLEKPNIEVVTEMVGMIEAQRSYEAYTKIISSTQDMDSQAMKTGGAT